MVQSNPADFRAAVDQALRVVGRPVHTAYRSELAAAAHEVAGANDWLFRSLLAELERRKVAGPREKKPMQEATASESRRLNLTPASMIAPLSVRWLWQDRIPLGEITLTPGLAGVGKSTFHAWLIAQLTRGLLPGVHYGTFRPVIICAHEDSWERSIVPRLIAADADLSHVFRAEVVTDEDRRAKLTLPADIAALEAEIGWRGVALVSLDPLLSTIDRDLDSYKSREVRDALEPLQQLADRSRCAILGNAHFNKATGTDPLLRISGSTAFGEVCRAALAFAHDKETGERVISQAKNNLGRMDLPNLAYKLEPVTVETSDGDSIVTRLVLAGEAMRGVKDILDPHSDLDKGDRDIARDIILDELKAGSQSWDQIKKVLRKEDISEATGRRARDELRKADQIDKTGGGGEPWLWHTKKLLTHAWPAQVEQLEQLKDDHPEELAHSMSNGKPSGDAYLLNLLKEEEVLREGTEELTEQQVLDLLHREFGAEVVTDQQLVSFGGGR